MGKKTAGVHTPGFPVKFANATNLSSKPGGATCSFAFGYRESAVREPPPGSSQA